MGIVCLTSSSDKCMGDALRGQQKIDKLCERTKEPLPKPPIDYEYEFEKLHNQIHLYEEIGKSQTSNNYPSQPKQNKAYTFQNYVSSNNARDKKMTKDIFQLGNEPSVDSCQKKPSFIPRTYNSLNIFFNTNSKKKENQERNQEKHTRKCPDPDLYENFVEQRNNMKSPDYTNWSSGSVEEDKCDVKTKPFRRMENCLFSCFTTCVPWCVMRKIYWN